MGTILIDKLLHTVVKRKASDLHIAVGQPPVLRLDGHMKRLETKVLEPEDTVALMKSIAPERSQKELQEKGGADFGFAFGDLCRFRVSLFKQKGYVVVQKAASRSPTRAVVNQAGSHLVTSVDVPIAHCCGQRIFCPKYVQKRSSKPSLL